MEKVIYYCDRCGEVVEITSCKFNLFKPKFKLKKRAIDEERLLLCQKCCDSLVKWFSEVRE